GRAVFVATAQRRRYSLEICAELGFDCLHQTGGDSLETGSRQVNLVHPIPRLSIELPRIVVIEPGPIGVFQILEHVPAKIVDQVLDRHGLSEWMGDSGLAQPVVEPRPALFEVIGRAVRKDRVAIRVTQYEDLGRVLRLRHVDQESDNVGTDDVESLLEALLNENLIENLVG